MWTRGVPFKRCAEFSHKRPFTINSALHFGRISPSQRKRGPRKLQSRHDATGKSAILLGWQFGLRVTVLGIETDVCDQEHSSLHYLYYLILENSAKRRDAKKSESAILLGLQLSPP